MKKTLLALTATITSIALIASLHLATLDHPTDIQQQLSTTTNAITIAGATAIFKLLESKQDKANPR